MSKPTRVMWLLNHTTARRFEVDMLKRLGFREIFLPKSFPQDIAFRSASIDASEDAALSIPASDLAVLNETNWYSEPTRDAWDIANRHFDLLFCMMWPPLLRSLSDHFRGAAIMRAYGLSKDISYSASISKAAGGLRTVENMGRRFWLGTADNHLAELESPWLQKREVYLPLGLRDCQVNGCWTAWKMGLDLVLTDLDSLRKHQPPFRRHRVAIIVPVAYRGGTLRSAKLLAEAVSVGSRESGEEVEVVLAYNSQVSEAPESTAGDKWDAGLPSFIARRTISWEQLGAQSALRAMRYAGHTNWTPAEPEYMVPDDRIHNLVDCDLWIIVSDRLETPLLPIRPYVMIVFDYVQRYNSRFASGADSSSLAAARSAKKVLVTTRFTELDAITYAGLSSEKVVRVPMLTPHVESWKQVPLAATGSYLLWTTNLASHKNHYNALCALYEYYKVLDGRLDCCVTGVETDRLLNGGSPHLESLRIFLASRPELTGRLRILGELPDEAYQTRLAAASFLWHPASIDNGTLAVVEAAALGVPSLSSRYPAMEEMDEQFKLHLTWMESSQPSDMAYRLKWMEDHASQMREELPTMDELAAQTVTRNAAAYWSAIRECL